MARPLAVHRHDEIVRQVRTAGTVSVAELAQIFAVSHETIRRDLKLLSERGHLTVVHGGATRTDAADPVFTPPAAQNHDGQAAIARMAANLVPDGTAILLDCCPTAAAIARQLVGRRDLTICTNSLASAALLCRAPGNRVYMLGGEVDSRHEATIGIDVSAAISHLRLDIAFVGIAGFARSGEPTDLSREAAEMRGRMLASAKSYLIADSTKFEQSQPFRIPHFERAEGLITDRMPDGALAGAWSDLALNVLIAD